MYTCYVCMHVYMWIRVCMDGYQRSTSGVGPHLLQGLRLGLSLVGHCCEWQESWPLSIQKFSVSISHLAVCMLVLQMWTSHTPFGGLWGSETRVPMLVHQGMCSVSHLPIPNLDRVSSWARSPQIWLDWLAIKLQICHLRLPGPEISGMATTSLLLGCWGFKLRPSCFQVNTFRTELALRLS